jgi:hypothetical protein
VGTQLPLAKVAIALLAAAAGALLLARAGGRERQGALLAAAIGTVAVALPLAAAILGVDYFIARNVIAALPPLSIVVAAGLAAAPSRTLRVAAPAALCGLLAAVWIAVLVDSDRHRTDWRALSGELGDPSGPRALLADAGAGARTLKVYRPEVRALPVDGERVRELVLLGEADLATAAPPSLDGWRLVDTASVQKLSFARYRSPRPIRVAPSATLPPPFPSERTKSLIEMQSAPGAQDIPEPGFCRGDWAERGTATIVGEEGDRANAQLRQSTPGSSHRRYPG